MAIFNSAQFNAGVIAGNVQQKLIAHRKALADLADLYAWSSGTSAADLQAIGFSAADASALLSAIADAHAESVIHNTGQAPSTYPQVTGTPYPYGASQTTVIGPQ